MCCREYRTGGRQESTTPASICDGQRSSSGINTFFNIGKGSTISVLELAGKISDRIEFIAKREGEAEITFADITKAGEMLGWKPELELEEYIREELNGNLK